MLDTKTVKFAEALLLAVSPECKEIVASKRNLKNKCKNLERQPLQRLQLCRQGGDHPFMVYLMNNRKNDSYEKEAPSQEVKLLKLARLLKVLKLMFKSTGVVQTDLPQRRA